MLVGALSTSHYFLGERFAMNFIGYKTFHWLELAKLLGVETAISKKFEKVALRPEDFGGKISACSAGNEVRIQNQVSENGWYCIGILEDQSLNLANRFHGKSRGESVEKFFRSFIPVREMWPNKEDNEAVEKGCFILNHPALPCLDTHSTGWVKLED